VFYAGLRAIDTAHFRRVVLRGHCPSFLNRSEDAAAWSHPWAFAAIPVNHMNGSKH